VVFSSITRVQQLVFYDNLLCYNGYFGLVARTNSWVNCHKKTSSVKCYRINVVDQLSQNKRLGLTVTGKMSPIDCHNK